MCSDRNPLFCYIPPYILESMAASEDDRIRKLALEALQFSAETRAVRSLISGLNISQYSSIPSFTEKQRMVYDMENMRYPLPGKLVRSEGDRPTGDEAVDEAYDHAGITWDFYYQLFSRNSIDNRGMPLVSSVHLGIGFNNAFWNGSQMAYGDGDGKIFIGFTKALDVVAHEMTHGVISSESNLEYRGEPGALNESFADVFGALVQQWHNGQKDPKTADWDMGELIMGSSGAQRLRTFKAEKAFEDDPCLGTDPQPKHLKDKYTGTDDNGGVHLNSGIPNHAFYRTAAELASPAWEKAGKIWYQALRNLNSQSDFCEAAEMTYQIAGTLYSAGSLEQKAVRTGWKAAGIDI